MSNTAQRMRQHRYRRALGLRVVRVPVSIDVIQALLEAGLVDGPNDEGAVSEALAEVIEENAIAFARDASRDHTDGG